MFDCPHCGGSTTMQVTARIKAPAELTNQFSKTHMRRKDVHFMGVYWESADYICDKCGVLVFPREKKDYYQLLTENDYLKLQLLSASEGTANAAKAEKLYREAEALLTTNEETLLAEVKRLKEKYEPSST